MSHESDNLRTSKTCPRIGWGWSGGAKVWVNFQCRGVLLVWMIVEQGPIALAVCAGGGCFLFSFSLSLEDGPI